MTLLIEIYVSYGTEAIKSIIPSNFCLHTQFGIVSEPSVRNSFAAKTFRRMCKLRFLYLKNVDLTGSFKQTFIDLRWLYWWGCQLKCLPSEFDPQKLVFLALPGSKMKTMWEPNMVGTDCTFLAYMILINR